MSTSLSKLVDNISEGLHNDECKDCKSYLDYVAIKDNQGSALGALAVKRIMKKILIRN